ncbi:protein DMP2-like [Senna tora]|uniref:Protein DMP2-like n=1 Tax=Senna tora TaxID=362788 RepID=A0A834X2N2_9FABA|nr:protein DMP2-like [Senna tora]
MASSSSASSSSSISSKTLSGLGSLIKLLPTGTVFLFQFLNPVVTDNGHCNASNKSLTAALLTICAFNCCFSCFTDSYTAASDNNRRHYAIVTAQGLYPAPASDDKVNLNNYKLRLGDFVHAVLGLVVFAALGLLDSNTVRCFYPGFESTGKILLQVLPPVIGVAAGAVFMIFPNTRHGIGYPISTDDGDSNKEDKANNTNRVAGADSENMESMSHDFNF